MKHKAAIDERRSLVGWGLCVWDGMRQVQVKAARLAKNCKAQPTAGVIEGQSVKPLKAVILGGMMQANGSRAASATS